jgi:hypothetical protein
MKKIAGFLGLVASIIVLNGPAWTAPGNRINVITTQSLVERVQSCRAGTYWCPGQISGCCPNGYGCGSTHCIKPGAPRVSAPTVRTPPPPSVSTQKPNVRRISPPTVRTTTPGVRAPTITGNTPTVPSPTVRTNANKPTVNVKTPRVPRNDTGACPSLKGFAAEMGGVLGC